MTLGYTITTRQRSSTSINHLAPVTTIIMLANIIKELLLTRQWLDQENDSTVHVPLSTLRKSELRDQVRQDFEYDAHRWPDRCIISSNMP